MDRIWRSITPNVDINMCFVQLRYSGDLNPFGYIRFCRFQLDSQLPRFNKNPWFNLYGPTSVTQCVPGVMSTGWRGLVNAGICCHHAPAGQNRVKWQNVRPATSRDIFVFVAVCRLSTTTNSTDSYPTRRSLSQHQQCGTHYLLN